MTLEELKRKNPWKELTDKVKARNYIRLEENILECDKQAINSFNMQAKDVFKYHLEVMPHPWDGDILNAKILILATNPGYVENSDKVAFEKLMKEGGEDKVKEFIKYKCDNLTMDNQTIVHPNKLFDDINDNYWRKMVNPLKGLLNIAPEEAGKQIAVLNYVGYASEKFRELYKINNFSIIESQMINKDILKYHIDKGTVIIIARKEKTWVNFVEGLDKSIVLKNYRRPFISLNNCIKRDSDFEKIKLALLKS